MHGAFFRAGHAVGVVHPADTLSGLKLYIIPHLELFDPAWLPALVRFVTEGGTLVIGARTACKDLNNNVVAETLPGVLRDLVGATVEEYGRQNRPDVRPLALRLAGSAAITRRAVGPGQVVYVGTYLTREFTEALLPLLGRLDALPAPLSTTPRVEIVERVGQGGAKLQVLINHNETPIRVPLPPGASRELLSERALGAADRELELAPHSVALVRC